MRPDHDDIDAVLETLVRERNTPLSEASSLPPVSYLSSAFHRLENERLFAREWVCVGHADELPETGDYVCSEVAGEQLVLVRQADRAIAALSNVCRHRAARLLEGTGRCERIVCPYHGWTSGLDGRLRGASYMEDARGFEASAVALPRLRFESWKGFLFVNLDDDAAPLAAKLTPLESLLGYFHIEEMSYHPGGEMVWEANWKVVTENFTENYHTFRIHPETLNQRNPTRLTRMLDLGGDFHVHIEPYNREGERLPGSWHPDVPPEARDHTVLFAVFPSSTFGAHARRTFSFTIFPMGPERSRVKWGIATRDGMPEDQFEQVRAAYAEIIAEDQAVVEGVQTALRSRRAGRGRLSALERSTWDLGRYLTDRLL